MAVTVFNGGWVLGAAGDIAESASGRKIMVSGIYIKNDANAGGFTFKDGSGNFVVTTNSIGASGIQYLNFGAGWETDGVEFDAKVGTGGGTITVFGVFAD